MGIRAPPPIEAQSGKTTNENHQRGHIMKKNNNT